MRVVVCPDKLAGTLTAPQAAWAIASAWGPQHDVVTLPLSDGGPGFLDALPGTRVTALVEDPLARPVLAGYVLDGATAYVECAQAAGLHLLADGERDPGVTTTYGVGQLVAHAIEAGATRVVVGLGGTATNDGGAGMLTALGVRREDGTGGQLRPGGLALLRAARLVGQPRRVELVAATDVDNPLLGAEGASALFGPQKGASPGLVEQLDGALAQWADLLEDHLGVSVRGLPGAGAGGGLGFALLALGAQRVSGFDVVAGASGLAEAVAGADLVITAEGRLDGTSLRGKVVGRVAALAAEHGVPCVAVAGEVLLGRREAGAAGLAETWSLVEHAGERALTQPDAVLREVAGRVAGAWGGAHWEQA